MQASEVSEYLDLVLGDIENPTTRAIVSTMVVEEVTRRWGHNIPGVGVIFDVLSDVRKRTGTEDDDPSLYGLEGSRMDKRIAEDQQRVERRRQVPSRRDRKTTRGVMLRQDLQQAMSFREYQSLIGTVGGQEKLERLVLDTSLVEGRLEGTRIRGVVDTLLSVPAPSRAIALDFSLYQRGYSYRNPLNSLTPATIPVIRGALQAQFEDNPDLTGRDLRKKGWNTLLNAEGGLANVLMTTNPDIARNVTLRKWDKGEDTRNFVLGSIDAAVYSIPGINSAGGNPKLECEALNRYFKEGGKLTDLFFDHGLETYIRNMGGFKKGTPYWIRSLSLFRGFARSLEHEWLDRGNDHYVQEWRAVGSYQPSKELVPFVLNAIDDFIRSTEYGDAYKIAEVKEDRETQVAVVNSIVEDKESLRKRLNDFGLDGFMRHFVDTDGETGFTRKNDPLAVFEFLDYHKGYSLFDREADEYVPRWKFADQFSQSWSRGEFSVELALETVEDVLLSTEYGGQLKVALKDGTREDQVEIVNAIARDYSMGYLFKFHGLEGFLRNFHDGTGETGLKAKSAFSALEFYSEQNKLGWFDLIDGERVRPWLFEGCKWNEGEKSESLAMEALEYALYSSSIGNELKEAERLGLRDKQVELMKGWIKETPSVCDYLVDKGLGGMLLNFVRDGDNPYGFRKQSSARAVLEWYSDKKGLDWFSKDHLLYIPRSAMKEQGIWQSDDSHDIAIDYVIDYFFEHVDGAHQAAITGKTNQHRELMFKFLDGSQGLQAHMCSNGAGGAMRYIQQQAANIPDHLSTLQMAIDGYSNMFDLDLFNVSEAKVVRFKGKVPIVIDTHAA